MSRVNKQKLKYHAFKKYLWMVKVGKLFKHDYFYTFKKQMIIEGWGVEHITSRLWERRGQVFCDESTHAFKKRDKNGQNASRHLQMI